MKIIMKPVEMIAAHDIEGKITPVKFKYPESDTFKVVRVERVLDRRRERIAGNHMRVFLCQTTAGEREIRFELKYEVNTQKWFLSKI